MIDKLYSYLKIENLHSSNYNKPKVIIKKANQDGNKENYNYILPAKKVIVKKIIIHDKNNNNN